MSDRRVDRVDDRRVGEVALERVDGAAEADRGDAVAVVRRGAGQACHVGAMSLLVSGAGALAPAEQWRLGALVDRARDAAGEVGMGAVDAAVDHRHLSPAPAGQVPGGLGAGEEHVPLREVGARGVRVRRVELGIVRRVPELRAVLGMDAGDEGVIGELGPQPIDRAAGRGPRRRTRLERSGPRPGGHCVGRPLPAGRGRYRAPGGALRAPSPSTAGSGGVRTSIRARPVVSGSGCLGGPLLRQRGATCAHRNQHDGGHTGEDERRPEHSCPWNNPRLRTERSAPNRPRPAERRRRLRASSVTAASRTPPVIMNLTDDSSPSRLMPFEIEPITSAPSRADQTEPRPPNRLVPAITGPAIALQQDVARTR